MISEVLGEAFDVYRRLWRRSVVVAGLVFAVVELAVALTRHSSSIGPTLLTLVLSVVGGLLVQGALVEVVRDLHEARAPAPISTYYDRTRAVLGTLLGASLIAGLGIGIGFILLVVPGLILFARWSLVVPAVLLEGRTVGDALRRSNGLVKGQTGKVLVVAIAAGLIQGLAGLAIHYAFLSLPGFWAVWVGGTVASAITVPYLAHVLTVLYYKLTEPDRPVLPVEPPREGWRSVWDEEPPA
ncbi:MAG: hypothetical protein ACRDLM_07955 [Gaiellaceae bacterium]